MSSGCRMELIEETLKLVEEEKKAANEIAAYSRNVREIDEIHQKFEHGEVEFFTGVCDPQFFFCGHPDFDDVCLSFLRRVIAVLLCVYVRTFHFSHIRPPVKMINARSGMERAM